jgi:hypothetical protein
MICEHFPSYGSTHSYISFSLISSYAIVLNTFRRISNSMDDKNLYYDLAKFETEMIATRSNFLLVFQSMLFGAVASLADKKTFIPIWLLIVLGFLTSVVWLYMNWLTSVVGEAALDRLKGADSRIDDIFIQQKTNIFYRRGSISWMMTWLFPLLSGIVWLIILVSYFQSSILVK